MLAATVSENQRMLLNHTTPPCDRLALRQHTHTHTHEGDEGAPSRISKAFNTNSSGTDMANSNQSAKKRMNKSEQNEEFQRLSPAVKLSNVSDMFVLQRKS